MNNNLQRPASKSDDGMYQRLVSLESQLRAFLGSPMIRFDDRCRRTLPEHHGVYRIFNLATSGVTVRAGRTKTAQGGLRQRVYQNHLMGKQNGNLRAQMVADDLCSSLDEAKALIRKSYAVQVFVIDDAAERAWFEHFMLGVLRPANCD